MMPAPTRLVADPSLIAILGAFSWALAAGRFDVHQVNRLMLERMGLVMGMAEAAR